VHEDGLEVVRQWRPPERPFNRVGFPAGTSAAIGAWWSLRRGEDDVVQGWTAPAALAAARSGKPSVYVFQGVLHEDDVAQRPRVRAMVERAARECEVVTAYSDVAADALRRILGIEARAIEPGIQLDAFTPADAGGGADAGGFAASARHSAPAIFCAADPDEPRKRVGLLVDAFRRLAQSHPEAELWLMRASDPAIARVPGVRIVDPGADRDALVRLYRSAWVTVLPAFREAFGLVVAESLACGTPVIGMRDGGAVPDLIGDAGWVADPDAESLATAIEAALEARPDPATCRRRAEAFSIERCAVRYEALYEELLAA
jgi:glycosyltransferase involved in cell wall biosynthesis